tara:strand:+ start:57268 stop:57510 length:243 start_codon:yes stop_codon:yes gene_type:complete
MAKKSTKADQTESGTEPRYEELIDQLEGIVDRIESGEIGLEESIKGYEQGIGLVKRAREILDRAEQRITELDGDAIDPKS